MQHDDTIHSTSSCLNQMQEQACVSMIYVLFLEVHQHLTYWLADFDSSVPCGQQLSGEVAVPGNATGVKL